MERQCLEGVRCGGIDWVHGRTGALHGSGHQGGSKKQDGHHDSSHFFPWMTDSSSHHRSREAASSGDGRLGRRAFSRQGLADPQIVLTRRALLFLGFGSPLLLIALPTRRALARDRWRAPIRVEDACSATITIRHFAAPVSRKLPAVFSEPRTREGVRRESMACRGRREIRPERENGARISCHTDHGPSAAASQQFESHGM